FTINTQLVNRGLISSLGDLEIFTPEFINTNGGSIVTGLYLNQTNEVIAGNLTFDLNIPADFNSGRFTNEGVIYSQGNLDIVDAFSVFNQNNATLMSQGNMIINADELINDQSRIETIVGNLTLNINHDLINRSDAPTYTASALSGSYSGSATTPGD